MKMEATKPTGISAALVSVCTKEVNLLCAWACSERWSKRVQRTLDFMVKRSAENAPWCLIYINTASAKRFYMEAQFHQTSTKEPTHIQ